MPAWLSRQCCMLRLSNRTVSYIQYFEITSSQRLLQPRTTSPTDMKEIVDFARDERDRVYRRASRRKAKMGLEGAADLSPWRDRTAENSDLKDTFSQVRPGHAIPDDVVARAHFLCTTYLGGAWKKAGLKDFTFKQITGGMSNLLFLVQLSPTIPSMANEPRRALLRVHCQSDIDQLLTESVVFTLLSERTLGPRLLGVFPGGRFEQFIPSRPLTCDEISLDRLIVKIAPMLARVHSLDVPIGKEPQIINRARQWLDKWMLTKGGRDGISMKLTKADVDPDRYPKYLSGRDLLAELSFVEEFLERLDSPIVFSHNDLQEGNILLIQDENGDKDAAPELSLIDFEYCDYNYRGFDFGNHCCEYGIDYSTQEYPCYEIYQERFDLKEERKLFCSEYLNELYAQHQAGVRLPPDLCSFNRDVDLARLQLESFLFMPVSHIFWACWALINAEESSIAFGYAEYARDRLALYFERKATLEEFLQHI